MWCLVVAFVLAEPVYRALPGHIETVAGTGAAGYRGDGGSARQAQLNQPFHLALDREGHLYVADALNHCIRRIDLRTGLITTVAGRGVKGYSGDGGPALRAALNEPYAVAVGQRGDLYIVDRLNAVVRKVDGRTGRISTIAGSGRPGYRGDGGSATAALLHEPNDCVLDGRGGLLIADVADWRVRRVDLATGRISTFAGTGRSNSGKDRAATGDGGPATRAVLVGPRGVCVDGQGNTYICEREGNAVRRVDPTGRISTIAGKGTAGYSGDGGDALRATLHEPKGIRCDADGNLFVIDAENNAIRRVDARSNRITTVAGGRRGSGGDGDDPRKAGLAQPHGCISDERGDLYIADTLNHRVRWVSARQAEPDAPRLPLVTHEDFSHGTEAWQPTDPKAWKIINTEHGKAYSLFQQSKYEPLYRSPFNFALRKDVRVGDFILKARVQSTVPDYPHRDMCVIFGYQDPAHFYYVHLGKKTDEHANQIFIVNGAPRTKISTRTTPGTDWDDGWHEVKVVRRVGDGAIEVYFDDMRRPIMMATDKQFTWGQVGLGSFDDTGNWSDVFLHGLQIEKRTEGNSP
jgi:streptogramin lyase